ncbi:DUF7660 family protein [Gottfriedia acidiceleris]|uniref:DUF7660 family protein n=1 Tax=Gottfriedia acidiceleris TaxID=371036 RepID=UPI0030007F37
MDIWEKCENVKTKNDFIMFVESLRSDLNTNEVEWENVTLEAYLEAMKAWMTDTDRLSDSPSWKDFAVILLSGRFYE